MEDVTGGSGGGGEGRECGSVGVGGVCEVGVRGRVWWGWREVGEREERGFVSCFKPDEPRLAPGADAWNDFSSSLFLRQAAFGLRLRSGGKEEEEGSEFSVCHRMSALLAPPSFLLPLTWCSKLPMTDTAWWRIISLVWAFSHCRYSWQISPNSLNASLMSLTRILYNIGPHEYH